MYNRRAGKEKYMLGLTMGFVLSITGAVSLNVFCLRNIFLVWSCLD